MRGVVRSLIFVGLVGCFSLPAFGQAEWSASRPLRVVGRATAVAEWIDFCRRYPRQCDAERHADRSIALDASTIALLEWVNRSVNNSVDQMDDDVHWGVDDRWDLPTDGRGDCEDFVLEKRRRLIEAGLPRSALAVTIVWTEANTGHAVLLVRTDRGDYVLDHLTTEVKPWCSTPYRYVKRQSGTDENEWVSLFSENRPVECAPNHHPKK